MSSNNLNFYGQFTASKAGKTGLGDVTPSGYQVTRGANPPVKSGLSMAGIVVLEIGLGVYTIGLTGLDVQTYDYVVFFTTADATVDLKNVPTLQTRWSEGVTTDASGRVQVQAGTAAGQINASGGKVPATLMTGDVSGNLPVNVAAINGAAVKGTGVAGNEWGPA